MVVHAIVDLTLRDPVLMRRMRSMRKLWILLDLHGVELITR